MIDLTTKIAKSSDYIEAPVDDDIVLMHTQSGKFFGLSETGRRIWELMDEQDTVGAVVEKVLNEFEVDRQTCESEVSELCRDFEKRDLIKLD